MFFRRSEILKDKKHSSLYLLKNMLVYLFLDKICSSKLTSFLVINFFVPWIKLIIFESEHGYPFEVYVPHYKQ